MALQTFQANKDAYIFSSNPTSNNGSSTVIVAGRIGTANYRTAIEFDLSSLPHGSIVKNAYLEFVATTTVGTGEDAEVRRLTKDWSEAQVTWNQASIGDSWDTAGGDFVQELGVEYSLLTATGTLQIGITSLTQDALDNRDDSLNLLVKKVVEAAPNNYNIYSSSEHATVANRPKLVVEYDLAPYVELREIVEFTNSSASTWQVKDITGDLSIPDDAVLEVLMLNASEVNESNAGVRTSGSSISRLLDLHEAEGGGNEVGTMHVQLTNGAIEHFSESTTDVTFRVLGYWAPGTTTYVETTGSFPVTTNATWENISLASIGVSSGDIVECHLANAWGTQPTEMGVREVGSTLNRIIDLHEAESGGEEYASMLVRASGSTIQGYIEDDTRARIKVFGYFSNANLPGEWTEEFALLINATFAGLWEQKVDTNIPNPSESESGVTIHTVLSNDASNTPHTVGVRDPNSTTDKFVQLHEAESFGSDFFSSHVHISGQSYDIYTTFANTTTPRLLGYWLTPVPPISNSLDLFIEGHQISVGNEKAYFASGSLVECANLIDGSDVQNLYTLDELPDQFHIDSLTRKLWYNSTAVSGIFNVVLADGSDKQQVIDSSDIGINDVPKDFDIHPTSGFVFLSSGPNDPRIQRVDYDGSNVTDLSPSSGVGVSITAVSVDPVNDILYWSNPDDTTIFRSDLDGNNVELFYSGGFSPFEFIQNMDIDPDENVLLWINGLDGTMHKIGLDSKIDTVIDDPENLNLNGQTIVAENARRRALGTVSDSTPGPPIITAVTYDGAFLGDIELDFPNGVVFSAIDIDPVGGLDLFIGGKDNTEPKLYWITDDSKIIGQSRLDGSLSGILTTFSSIAQPGRLENDLDPSRPVYYLLTTDQDLFEVDQEGNQNLLFSSGPTDQGIEVDHSRNIVIFSDDAVVTSGDITTSATGTFFDDSTIFSDFIRSMWIDHINSHFYYVITDDFSSATRLFRRDYPSAANKTQIYLIQDPAESIQDFVISIADGKIYVLSTDTGPIYRVRSMNLDGSNVSILAASAASSSQGMGIHVQSRSLFVANQASNQIDRVDMDTGNITTILDDATAGTDDPRDVLIQPDWAIPLFMPVFDIASGSLDLSITGHEPSSGTLDLFVGGKESQSGAIDLFIDAFGVETNSLNLFIGGVDNTKPRLYWITDGSQIVGQSRLDGSASGLLDNASGLIPFTKLANDQDGKRPVYYGSETVGTLYEVNKDGDTIEIFGSGLDDPGIEIDHSRNLGIISNDGLVATGLLDGTDGGLFFSEFSFFGNDIPAMELDLINDHLYYILNESLPAARTILRRDYPSTENRTIINQFFSVNVFIRDIALDIAGQRIYALIYNTSTMTTNIRVFGLDGTDFGSIFTENINANGLGIHVNSRSLFVGELTNNTVLRVDMDTGNFTTILNDPSFATNNTVDTIVQPDWAIPLTMISPFDVSSGSLDLTITGHDSVSGSLDLFIEGKDNVSGTLDLFVDGKVTQSGAIDLFVEGRVETSGSLDLFINGAFINEAELNLFVAGDVFNENFLPLFIGGISGIQNNLDLFILGAFGNNNDLPLTIFGQQSISGQLDLFIEGFFPSISGGLDLYTEGSGIIPITGQLDLIICGFEPKPPLVCPIPSPDDAIQITDTLIGIYQNRIDALINQIGKNVTLEFDPVKEVCPNCEFDPMRNRSRGRPKPGGPRPFKPPRQCPYCKALGFVITPQQKCIKALVRWRPRDAANYGISVRNRNAIVKLKTFLTDAVDLQRANTLIVDSDQSSMVIQRVKKVKGPVPRGLRENRYAVSFWELI